MLISMKSVGKDYFFIDKNNLTTHLRSRVINIFGSFGLIEEIQQIESFIKNESNNKNSGAMTRFDPNLPLESQLDRNNELKPIYKNNFNAKNLPNSINKDAYININSGGLKNLRYFDASLGFDINNLNNNIKLHKIIDSTQINKFPFLSDVPVQASPIFDDGVLYFVTRENSVTAWSIKDDTILFNLRFVDPPARRGMLIYQDKIESRKTLYFNVSSYIVAVDAFTGEFISEFGENGYKKVGFGTSAPMIINDILISAINEPPRIIAMNKNNGEELWSKNIDGGAPWAGFSIDYDLGIIFVTTGNPKPPLFGGNRINANKEANSLIALNYLNGKTIWSIQDVYHDLWDFDIASPPSLVNLDYDGFDREVVVAPTKRGNLIVANRRTGKLIKEPTFYRAPISDVNGEKTAPFQHVINIPKPFLDHQFNKDDLRKDLDRESKINLDNYKMGFFETPSLKKVLISYGLHGGATWPGISVDKDSNQMFVAVNKVPWKLRLFLQDFSPKDSFTLEHNGKSLYEEDCSSCHGDKRNGLYINEKELELNVIPSLVGVKHTNAIQILSNIDLFQKSHVNNLSRYPQNKLNHVAEYLNLWDDHLFQENKVNLHFMWSMFLDKGGIPINKPPYGEVFSYDLETLEINWTIPVGDYSNYRSQEKKPTGQFIYGGMASVSNILFVTGGPDRYVRAYNTNTTKKLWEYKMDAAGSSPPIIFTYDDRNFLSVVSTGGKFSGYDHEASKIYIFELLRD